MDGKEFQWIEGLTDEVLFALNDLMCKQSIDQGYFPGKTETKWWRCYTAIVDECTLRNAAKRKVWQ